MPTSNTDRPIALVTGASRGIGRAIARELGRTHHILVGGRDADAVVEVVAELPSAEPFMADLVADLSGASLPALPERLDVLVHSAGVEDGGTVEETDAETWQHVFEVNVFAVAALTRRALPALRAAQGLVVSINSGSGLASGPGGGVYAGSKFALRALTDALREEERQRAHPWKYSWPGAPGAGSRCTRTWQRPSPRAIVSITWKKVTGSVSIPFDERGSNSRNSRASCSLSSSAGGSRRVCSTSFAEASTSGRNASARETRAVSPAMSAGDGINVSTSCLFERSLPQAVANSRSICSIDLPRVSSPKK